MGSHQLPQEPPAALSLPSGLVNPGFQFGNGTFQFRDALLRPLQRLCLEMGGAEVHLEAESVSAVTLSRLKQVWVQDYCRWNERRRDRNRRVYLWADGVYSVLRAE